MDIREFEPFPLSKGQVKCKSYWHQKRPFREQCFPDRARTENFSLQQRLGGESPSWLASRSQTALHETSYILPGRQKETNNALYASNKSTVYYLKLTYSCCLKVTHKDKQKHIVQFLLEVIMHSALDSVCLQSQINVSNMAHLGVVLQ